MRTPTSHQLFYISLPVIVAITLLVYWPGLSSTFLLDDIPNLKALGEHGNHDITTRLPLFLLSGDSGPTGRPVSLLSFYLNASSWPGDPFVFKLTNLAIHLLNGALIFWISHLILRNSSMKRSSRDLITGLTTLLWLVHPLQVSTTLYVIQRMTELSALFTLCALIVWLYGRDILLRDNRILLWRLIIFIPLLGILAILSKENGALIPFYILSLEILLRKLNSKTSHALNIWVLFAAVIPSLLLFIYVLYRGISSELWLLSRPYTFSEHLLSQFHALSHYLMQIVMPRTHGMGLFHDDFPVSQGLLNPIETLYSVILIILLIYAAWAFRNRAAVFSFAILWFFSGHIMESTFLPLELYFEHRNYLAMYGIVFSIAWGIESLAATYSRLSYILLSIYTLSYMVMTYTNTGIWGRPLEAAIIWADENPGSIRAQMTARSAIRVYATRNRLYGEQFYIDRMLQLYPGKPTVEIEALDFQCAQEEPDTSRLEITTSSLETARLHITDLSGLQKLVDNYIENRCRDRLEPDQLLQLLSAAMKNPSVQYASALHIIHYTYGRLYAELRNLDLAMHHLELSYSYKPVLDIRLRQVIYLQSAGLYKEAIDILDHELEKNRSLSFRLRRDEVQRLRNRIQKLNNTQGTG